MVGRYYFCKEGGCGVTMTNLFKGWPRDRIAIATYRVDPCEDKVCRHSYMLGSDEISMVWPFSLFQKKISSGIITSYSNKGEQNSAEGCKKKGVYTFLKKNIIKIVHLLGLYPLLVEVKISKKLLKFIDEYKPDIVYSQPANRVLIQLINKLNVARAIPTVFYIQDNWPETIGKEGIFSFFVRRNIDKELRGLINKASGLMGISQGMCDEYEKRYGRVFLPFSNPIESERWLAYSKINWQVSGPFKILYAGRIYKANTQGILDLCKVIGRLKDRGLDIRLDIYSKDADFGGSKKSKILDGVNINNPLAHEEMPRLLANYDLLFLPLDFNKANILLTQYSIPTKISEYMVSGTPILVYASPRTALYKYVKAEKSACLVSERNIEKLLEAVKGMYSNEQLRKSYGERAKEVAVKNHDAIAVRNNFRKLLIKASQSLQESKE